ncbi:MAG: diacylglycerol kinase family protein [Aggregatilineales bacterium]
MWSRLIDRLMGTSRIDPSEYAALGSPNRLQSLGYALAGWVYMLRRQKNTRLMSVASVLIIGLALWLQVGFRDMALLIVVITIVWLTEFLNAGIEAAVDLASPDIHPMAQVGKDVASAAVLLGVVASILVGLLILGPPLLLRLGWIDTLAPDF